MLLALLLFTRTLYTDFNREKDLEHWVKHTYQVLNDLKAVLSNLQAAEIGQRDYLLTGNESYIEPLQSAVRADRPTRQALRQLTADNPTQQAFLDTLEPLVTAKFSFLQRTVDLRRNAGLDAALAVVRMTEGKRIMDEIRKVLRSMEEEERRLLGKRTQAAEAQAMRMRWIMGLGSGSLLILLIICSGVIERHSRNIERAKHGATQRLRQALDAANAATWEWDLKTNENVWSAEAWKLLGLAPHSRPPSYDGWRQAVHPADRTKVTEISAQAAITGDALDIEYRVRDGDGTVRWLQSQGRALRDGTGCPARFIGIVRDITQHKWAEETLAQASEQRRLALETALQTESDHKFLLELGAALQAATSPEAIAELATRMAVDHFDVVVSVVIGYDVPGDKVTRLYETKTDGWISPIRLGMALQLSSFVDDRVLGILVSGNTLAIGDTATDPLTAPFYSTAYKATDIRAFVIVPWLREGRLIYAISVMVRKPRQWTQRETDLLRSASEQTWPFYEAARARMAERAMHTALASSEERLRIALQTGAIGIWESNPITGARFLDGYYKALYGFPLDFEPQLETILSCIHAEDRDMVQQAVAAFRDPAGTGRLEVEYRIHCWDDGRLRHLYAQGQTSFEGEDDNRHAVRSIGTIEDVTAVKQREEELRRTNRDLEQFAYAAAHDLQEPLRKVALTAQFLAEQYRGRFDAEADDLLEVISQEPRRMQAMVKDLLTFSRALESAEGEPARADSNKALALALKNLQLAIQEKHAEISWGPLPAVRMRESHLVQIFQNLVGNSLKYSGTKQPRVFVSSMCRDDAWVFFVQDNGMGIPPQYRERVFGVFKRLHGRSIPGTGIGLALCKRMVEHYGGRIWIESNGEEGTAVLFTPPVVIERSANPC